MGFELVTGEPVEGQDFRNITDDLRGIYGICLELLKKNRKIATCNRLDLELTRILTEYD